MEPLGLYLHIPFCRAKCPYCDFYSLPYKEETARRYAAALCRAMERWPSPRPVDTVYLGGGTPSLLGEELLCTLLETADRVFGILPGAEITLEANPGTLTLPLLKGLRRGGYNRISLGMQSAREEELALLGRRHRPGDAVRGARMALEAGFDNLSLDLMLGIPGQTPQTAVQSVEAAAALGPRHLSAYLLKVEPGTPFGQKGLPAGALDDDAQADCYLAAAAALEGLGFAQYEISNFAREGFASRHNLKYWNCDDYLGLGPAAHSLVEGRRFCFPRDLAGFLEWEDPFAHREEEGPGATAEEYIMLRLRLTDGLSLSRLKARWPRWGEEEAFARRAQVFVRQGLLFQEGDRYWMGPRGFLVSNFLLARLLED